MHYIYESIIVGIYTCIIYALISPILYKVHLILLFFVVGIIKHLIGYYLSIHEYYCKYKCGDFQETRIYQHPMTGHS